MNLVRCGVLIAIRNLFKSIKNGSTARLRCCTNTGEAIRKFPLISLIMHPLKRWVHDTITPSHRLPTHHPGELIDRSLSINS